MSASWQCVARGCRIKVRVIGDVWLRNPVKQSNNQTETVKQSNKNSPNLTCYLQNERVYGQQMDGN
jgi:hypothetical protein